MLLRKIGHRLEDIIVIILGQPTSWDIVGSIYFDNNVPIWVEIGQNGLDVNFVSSMSKATYYSAIHANQIPFRVRMVRGWTI
jgi:hypothetical protein